MLFNRIFVEERVKDNPHTQRILQYLKHNDYDLIEDVDRYFGRVKKPYLQKRDQLNLFIASKQGERVKEAPDAYGVIGQKHYYFVHAYNCIYECEYCYLQGYFNSPDIVLFVNHEEIIADMQRIVDEHKHETIWFHAGEFSDSLALAHITGEIADYWQFFERNPHTFLELRTKSANIKPILKLKALANCITSFSLSSDLAVKQFDHKTAGLNGRYAAIKQLSDAGYRIGIHLDPIIYHDNFVEDYKDLIDRLMNHLDEAQLEYVSLGVVRFSKDVYHAVEKNYPTSQLLAQEFIKADDGKIKYKRPHRLWMLEQIKQICIKNGITEKKIYFCMENV